MSESSKSIVPLIGRFLLSIVFLFSGFSKVAAFSMMTGFAAAKGMPFPVLMIGGAAFLEIFGGLGLLLGLQARIVGWALFLFLIPTTLIFHNFWALQGADRMDAQGHFMKNLAIMGGLLFVATFGAGAYSLDAKRANA